MQILARAADAEFQRAHAAIADGDRGLVGAPHRAVGRKHAIRLKQLRIRGDHRLQVPTADLLFALEDELHVERQRAARRKERLRDLDRNEHRSLVVGRAARVEAAVAQLWLEGLALPPLEGIGRLHVVVAVHKQGRRARCAQPFAVHHRMAAGREVAHSDGPGLPELRGHPSCGARDVVPMRRIGADARDACELDQLTKGPVVMGGEGFVAL